MKYAQCETTACLHLDPVTVHIPVRHGVHGCEVGEVRGGCEVGEVRGGCEVGEVRGGCEVGEVRVDVRWGR